MASDLILDSDEEAKEPTLFERSDSSDFASRLVTVYQGQAMVELQPCNTIPSDSNTQEVAEAKEITTSFLCWQDFSTLIRQLERQSLAYGLDEKEDQDVLESTITNLRQEINNLLLTKHSAKATTYLLANFRDLKNQRMITPSFDIADGIESFRTDFTRCMQEHSKTLTFKVALLRVAFNHYGGHSEVGYMTLEEFKSMLGVYDSQYSTLMLAKAIFDSMDRNKLTRIKMENFVAGMIACSPSFKHKFKTPGFKLRLQHIFRLYDVDRCGFLDKKSLSLLLSHACKLSRSKSQFDNVQEQIDHLVTKITVAFGNKLSYDAFYQTVEADLIPNLDQLLLSPFDLAQSIADHLAFALEHVVSSKQEQTVAPNKTLDKAADVPEVINDKQEPSSATQKAPLWSRVSSPVLDSAPTKEDSQQQWYNFPGLQLTKGWSGSTSPISARSSDSRMVPHAPMENFEDEYAFTFREPDTPKVGGHVTSDQVKGTRPEVVMELVESDTTTTRVQDGEAIGSESTSPASSDGNADAITNVTPSCDGNVDGTQDKIMSGALHSALPKNSNDTSIDIMAKSLEDTLEKRLIRLRQRYKTRYLGIQTCMLADDGVALKIMSKFYKRAFKNPNFQENLVVFDWCSLNELFNLCDIACSLCKMESNVISIEGPVQFFGAIEGDLIHLVDFFNTFGWPLHAQADTLDNEDSTKSSKKDIGLEQLSLVSRAKPLKLCFLGGIVSTSAGNNLETCMLLFCLKILFPMHVFLLGGGNPGIRSYSQGFYQEIYTKLCQNVTRMNLLNEEAHLVQSARELFERICDALECQSVACLVNSQVLGIYGTLPRQFKSLDQLQAPKPLVQGQNQIVDYCIQPPRDLDREYYKKILSQAHFGLVIASLPVPNEKGECFASFPLEHHIEILSNGPNMATAKIQEGPNNNFYTTIQSLEGNRQ
ncbi:bifunctional EF-hand domain/Metallo-dependent phosphatase-like/Serine-threonine-specific protein phosphatase-bis(5-nucleosyl)-tetraphosphatase/EF-hand domain pair [Babesia duncani]|uniref:Bifunctional EF-hand domain/Metallo-dependent phosphatase-like/Serine-threonine-specific protein phosphatase-bis(5-nucleosyl)-tetraphosphatase/EF-hand domain pair n=1 Tax=Babesia duncani TaxID=323732 RepID=A0AAD9PKS4_9APIC|nr:bifunctional EF-hand domain/Metallo-dependent phosphatase-like/Serine-threonine-specific protein phosphatase-bis(5-nucleosyl)-tetraphosphatase/EF-hand domain pair [Babesia duncani]